MTDESKIMIDFLQTLDKNVLLDFKKDTHNKVNTILIDKIQKFNTEVKKILVDVNYTSEFDLKSYLKYFTPYFVDNQKYIFENYEDIL